MNKFFLILTFFFNATIVFSQDKKLSWRFMADNPKGNYYAVKERFQEEYKEFKILWDNDISKKNKRNYKVKNHQIISIENENAGFDPMIKEFMRWELEISRYLDNNGNFNKFIKSVANDDSTGATSKSLNTTNFGENNWTPLGLFQSDRYYTPYDSYHESNIGKITSILFDKNDSLTYYIASRSSGVWKTTDGGKNWQFLSQDWDAINTNSIQLVADPNDSNIIYAIVGYSFYYKSVNGGINWEKKEIHLTNNQGFGLGLTKLVIDKLNPNNMLFSLNWSLNFLKSTDGGLTWDYSGGISEMEGYSRVESFIAHPTNSNIIYAATSTGRIYKSINGGQLFNSIYLHPDGLGEYSIRLAVTDAQPNSLYFSSVANYSSTHVFKSLNMGVDFNRLTPQNSYWYNQGGYCHALQVSPINQDEIWFGLGVMKKTNDGGQSWIDANYVNNYSKPNRLGLHLDFHALVFQPLTNKLFIGNDGGLYRYNGIKDNEFNYSFFSGYNATEVYRLGGLENEGNQIVFGTQDNGTHLFKDGKFVQIAGGDGMECFFDKGNTNSIFYSFQYGSLYNRNMNDFFGTVSYFSPGNYSTQWLVPWKKKGNVMLAAYDKLHLSTDNGQSWIRLNTSPDYCREIEIQDSNVFYGGGNFGVFKTINSGQSWFQVSNELSYSLKLDPNNPNIIYNLGNDLYKSNDGGATWINLGGIPNTPVTCLAIDKNNPNDLYIGSYRGVFVLQNNSWVPYNLGMPKVLVTDLEINYINGGKLMASTMGRGIWETNLINSCAGPSVSLIHSNNNSGLKALTASSDINSTYQWLKNGATLVGETGSIFTTNLPGDYSVIATKGNCSTLSEVIRICPNLEIVSSPIYGPDVNSESRVGVIVQANSEIFSKKVEFNAKNSIELYPGFIINSFDEKSTFKAEITGCNN